VEIDSIDCHGGVRARAALKTSNSAAPSGGTDLSGRPTPFGTRRFEWVNNQLIQRSVAEPNLEWKVSQRTRKYRGYETHYRVRSATVLSVGYVERQAGTALSNVPFGYR
jgi:hypothetical protein